MRKRRIAAIAAGTTVLLLAAAFGALQTARGQRSLASFIASVASTPDATLEIEGLSGFVPTDLRVAHVAYRDRQGAWLTVDNLHFRWSFGALFGGRLLVDVLSADKVEVLRSPEPGKPETAKKDTGPLKLPLSIDLRDLSVADLHLGAALAGVESHWKLAGNALLPSDLAHGKVVLKADRSDGPEGHLTTDVGFDFNRRTVDGDISLTEKKGGVVAALLQRPDLEDLSMRLGARGDARTGSAELTVAAGDAAHATGKASWQPKEEATVVSLQLETAGPGLPPGPIADLVRAPISLTLQGTVDDRLAVLNQARLTSGSMALAATARYDRGADKLTSTTTVTVGEPGPLGAFTGGVTWRNLQLEAEANLASMATPQGTVALKGSADDVSLAALDSRLPPLGTVTLAAALGLKDGKITVTSLDVGSPLAAVKGTGSYGLANQAGDAKATVSVPSLDPLAPLIGQPLTGNATVDVDLAMTADGLKGSWRGDVRDLGSKSLPDHLGTPKALKLSGSAALDNDETWSLSDVQVTSDSGTFVVSGRGKDSTGDLALSLDLPKLASLQPEISGAAKVNGTIKLRGDGTDLGVDAILSGLEGRGVTSRQLALSASATIDASGGLGGSVKLEGDLIGQPLALNGHFGLDAAGGVTIPAFKGRWASVSLNADDLAITKGRTSGYARLHVDHLQDFAALAGTPLAGSLEAEVTADNRAANGHVTARAQGSGLRVGGLAVGTLDFHGTVDDPMSVGTTEATLSANGIAGLADLNRLTATLKGDRKAVDVTLQTSGAQTSASLGAKVAQAADDIVVNLTRFEGRYGAIPVGLAGPTRVVIAGEHVTIDPTNLRLGGGRLSVRGAVAPTASDLQIELAGLPLSLIDAVAPGTDLEGTAQAKVRVTGAMAAPAAEATYSITGLRLKRPEAALLPSLSLQGSGSVMGTQASLDARLGATGGATSLTVKGKGTLPRGAAALSGSATIAGTIDLAPFAPLLGNDIRGISGTLQPNLTVDVSGSRVTGSGSIDFSKGAVSLPASGLRLSGGEGRLVLEGDTLRIQRLAFQATRGGTISASGSLRLDPQQGVVPDLAIVAQNALLVSRADLTASITSNLKVSGSTADGIQVSGPVTIDRADILVGAPQMASYPTLDVREIYKPGAPPPVAVAPVPAARPPAGKAAPAPGATPIKLALTIAARQAIFVRGRGLDAEMSGEFSVGGSPTAPSVTGGLTLRRGQFNLLGRRLTFSRGVVTLDNLDSIDPRLDFVATTTVQSTTLNVAITGTPRAPLVVVSSVPSLPPDEAMALLLFGKPTSSLSVFELAQAAQGLAELTGQASGEGALSRLRTGLGLDRLSVNAGNSSSTNSNNSSASSVAIEAGRYVAPGVYVGARQGATGNSSRGVVEVEVWDHVKLEGDIGADSSGKLGVKMEWDY